MSSKSKTAVVTGSSGLLGSVIVRALSARDWHVIAIDLTPPQMPLPHNVTFVQHDLADIAGISRLKAKVSQLTNCLKCLINNAAFNPTVGSGGSGFGKFEDLELDAWEGEVRLNLTSPVFLTKQLLDLFYHGDGMNCKIINILSIYGIVPPNQNLYRDWSAKIGQDMVKPIGYPVTKAALGMVTRYLAVYLARRGFNVNAVAPGGITAANQPKEFVEAYENYVPMGRMALANEIIGPILMLSGPESDYINGQILAVDGGWTVW